MQHGAQRSNHAGVGEEALHLVDCSTLEVWLMAKSVPACIYGTLEHVSVLVGDSPDAYTPKTLFYAELAVYGAFEQRETG